MGFFFWETVTKPSSSHFKINFKKMILKQIQSNQSVEEKMEIGLTDN